MGDIRRAAVLPVAIALLLAIALAGVLAFTGGDDGGSGSGESQATESDPPMEAEASGGGERDGSTRGEDDAPSRGGPKQSAAEAGRGGGGGPTSPGVDLSTDPGSIAGARLTASGAVQTLPPGASAQAEALDNTYASIRAFGAEAEGPEATEITFALLQYLSAKASGDWPTACARLYSVLRANLEQGGGKSCPPAYGELMSRVPAAARTEAAEIDVASVRRGEGDRAFVIYKTPETVSADMPMYLDGGVWTVGALEAYVLAPGQLGKER